MKSSMFFAQKGQKKFKQVPLFIWEFFKIGQIEYRKFSVRVNDLEILKVEIGNEATLSVYN